MTSAAKLATAPLSSEEIKEALADAVVLCNHFIVICQKKIWIPDMEIWSDDLVRHIQTHLLEAYREECNIPWTRFYEGNRQQGKKVYR